MPPLDTLFQTHDAWQWLFVAAAGVLLGVRVVRVYLAGAGRHGLIGRLLGGLERHNRLEPWAGAGIDLGLWALGVAFVGFMWDVAWHADTGRDNELFTVPHALILIGLGGIFMAGVLATVVANYTGRSAGWRLG